MTHSFNFLRTIPWTRDLARVPDLAGRHHEKLDGSGYPQGLAADDIPLGTRMMTIADIYDALVARDRPYKKALPLERALSILEAEAKAGKLDVSLVQLWIEAKAWEDIGKFEMQVKACEDIGTHCAEGWSMQAAHIAARNFESHLRDNAYPGRGLVIGQSSGAPGWIICYTGSWDGVPTAAIAVLWSKVARFVRSLWTRNS